MYKYIIFTPIKKEKIYLIHMIICIICLYQRRCAEAAEAHVQ